jgi:hypothetical protein
MTDAGGGVEEVEETGVEDSFIGSDEVEQEGWEARGKQEVNRDGTRKKVVQRRNCPTSRALRAS